MADSVQVNQNNKDRADRAEAALLAYATATNQQGDAGEVISDLLSDLQHLCQQRDICFASVLDRSTSHYTFESEYP